jgi:penicillin amidase
VRGKGDGRWLAPGWDPAYDWTGTVPFEELPHAFNPDTGMVVSANQAVAGPAYKHLLTTDWSYGYRSDRIGDMLDVAVSAGRRLSVADMELMLVDDRSGVAPRLVPALLAVPGARWDGGEAAGLELLRHWDFRQPADGEPGTPRARSSAASAFFNAIWRHLLTEVFDELPEHERPYGDDRWFEVLDGLLDKPNAVWWDRADTPTAETRDDALVRAVTAAHRELTDAQGAEPANWRWGAAHTLTLREQSLGLSGIAPVELLFNRGPVASGGGTDAVNSNGWNAAEGYDITEVPSMRMIVSLADLDNSRWIQVSGNSGHAYHRHYTDQLELWRTGRMLPWKWDRAAIEGDAVDTLTLTP